MKKVGIIVGSLRKESINRKLAEVFIKIGHSKLDFSFIDIHNIPLFSEDLENTSLPAIDVFRQKISESDLILLMTPEYNRSISGVLKNALDWASRPYGKSCLVGKEAAIAGASIGSSGTLPAQVHLRSILPVLGMKQIQHSEVGIVWNETFLNNNGLPNDERTIQFIQKFLEQLAQ
ncbi:MAG: NAD(P)H-dependent oxidoreductase [Alphaproteobacteria bacterium]|nr:NAD(P)H-dependent oxidoreductase [Alphaproteobacteria bacterium]